ncbi:MAG: hypothetical protein J6L05_03955 [Ruminococcus sp.]|nr:hypothetical protein [Ruminococcus sp.]
MRKQLSFGLTFGLIGNLLFILFALITYLYYITYTPENSGIKFLEILAYLCEFAAFGILVISDVLICRAVRMRKWLKIGYSFYIAMEAFMMFCELNSEMVISFYQPYSLALAIIHAIISAAVCFSFLSFDPYKTPFEVVVIICIGLILGGMFGNLLGIRIYFSILVNAAAFAALFGAIKYMLKKEIIEIDCHGDSARVAEYKSSFFDE